MDLNGLILSEPVLELIWFGLFIVLIIIELLTVGLTTIWFAGGCLAALASCFLGADLLVQILIFLLVSCVLLIFTRPIVIKHLNQKTEKTNYEAQIGKTVHITEKVDNMAQTGRGMIEGQEWTVRSLNDSDTFEKGTLAKVAAISGVKLIVEKYKED